jgi:hypothetical protein
LHDAADFIAGQRGCWVRIQFADHAAPEPADNEQSQSAGAK